MNSEVGMPGRNHDDVKWCLKLGTIVNNGSSTHVPVWVSSDGSLVLPVGGNGDMTRVASGSRIRMLRQIWCVCGQGDLATVTGIRNAEEGAPKSWVVTMNNGVETYVFEGEFEVVQDG